MIEKESKTASFVAPLNSQERVVALIVNSPYPQTAILEDVTL